MNKKRLPEFWMQTLSNTLGTVIGIVLTFGTTFCLQRCEQENTERTASLMVIHNLDNFCESIADDIKILETVDSLNSIVWQHSPDRLEKISDDTLQLFLNNLLSRDFKPEDNTAEGIFSTNIDTWKSIGNSEFVELAGKCFSVKRMMTKLREELDQERLQVYETFMDMAVYTDKPAQTLHETVARVFCSSELCCFIRKQHDYYLNGMKTGLLTLQEQNGRNKQLMKITDEELKQFGYNQASKTYKYEEKP
jgi:hypothetical protein